MSMETIEVDIDVLLGLRAEYIVAIDRFQGSIVDPTDAAVSLTEYKEERRNHLARLQATSREGSHVAFGNLFGINHDGFLS